MGGGGTWYGSDSPSRMLFDIPKGHPFFEQGLGSH